MLTDDQLEAIERDLVLSVRDAPEPLYSCFRQAQEQAPGLPLTEFIALVNRLLAVDVLQLWKEDVDRRLRKVPPDLPDYYAKYEHDDPTYDPFTLTLFLGSEGERREQQ